MPTEPRRQEAKPRRRSAEYYSQQRRAAEAGNESGALVDSPATPEPLPPELPPRIEPPAQLLTLAQAADRSGLTVKELGSAARSGDTGPVQQSLLPVTQDAAAHLWPRDGSDALMDERH